MLFDFGYFFLEVLADFEFDDGTGGNGYVFAGVLGVAAYFCLNLFDLECAEIADDDAVTLRECFGNDFNSTLNDVEHFILC